MVDNLNGLQQDFDVLILKCFESGINVSINTVCAWCHDTTRNGQQMWVKGKSALIHNYPLSLSSRLQLALLRLGCVGATTRWGMLFELYLSAGHAICTKTIDAARAALCNEPTFVDAVSSTAPPPSLLLPLNVDYMYYNLNTHMIPIKSIITLVLKY